MYKKHDALKLAVAVFALVALAVILRPAGGAIVVHDIAPAASGIHREDARALIDINAADRALLIELPGIGEATAEAILSKRAEINTFSSVDDLLEVSGIGPSKLEALRPLICAQ